MEPEDIDRPEDPSPSPELPAAVSTAPEQPANGTMVLLHEYSPSDDLVLVVGGLHYETQMN